MDKKFFWNTTLVYNLPYTLSLGITPSVTVPNYEGIFTTVEGKLDKMSEYTDATAVLDTIKKKFDDKC
jgi:hypothetical protein